MVIPDWSAPKDPNVEIIEAAGIPLEHLARPLDRLAAVIVDVFVLLVPLYILLSAPFKRWLTASFILGAEPEFITIIASMVALGLALLIFYQGLLHYFFGATLGKLLFDLRVRPVFPEQRPSLAASLTRSVIWLGEFFCFGLPFLAVFSNSKRRTLHDRICDTVVVSHSGGGVLAPGHWESGMVRGLFGACLLFAIFLGSLQARGIFERIKSEKSLAALVEHESGECDVVSKNIDENPTSHARLELAMSLYAAGLADRTCLEGEIEHEIATQTPIGPITYLAQAFVNSEDAEVSNSYLDQVCEEAPKTVECAMSKVVSRWSEEDWAAVEQILTTADKGTGYLEVWAVRHFMKQARYNQALAFLDSLADHHELAEFSLVQRVKALYNRYSESEASVALAQAVVVLPREDGEDLSAWVCAQQLQNGCSALAQLACKDIPKNQDSSEIDFNRSAPALARLMALECKNDSSVDYLTFSQAVKDEDWQLFFRANLKHQKDDNQAAFKLYARVLNSNSAPEILRVEALRRLAEFADHAQMAQVVDVWRGMDSKELWVKTGNLLFTHFVQKKDQEWALRVARHLMNSESLSPKALAMLTDIVQSDRKPASVTPPKAIKNLLDSYDEEGN